MTKINLQQLHKSYGKVKALDGVSLRLKERSFVVIAGPSGCGKSTLLQCIAGLLPLDSGCVLLNGEDITHTLSGERDIAMVFQKAALFPHLTVFDNIAIGLKKAGLSNDEIKTNVNVIARLLSIDDLLYRKADTLSGGQEQRVAIARAFIREPKLFLMDEPLSSLDASLRVQLRIEIAQLYQKLNATFIYVTHDQMEAMTLASTLVIMRDGRIQQAGTPQELYKNPINLFTASFLGKYKLNVLEGNIRNQVLYCFGKQKMLTNHHQDGEILVGVRMEHMYEEKDGIEGNIVLIEDVGDEVFYHVSMENHTLVMREMGVSHQVNDVINISFCWEHAFLFDKVTEERLFIG